MDLRKNCIIITANIKLTRMIRFFFLSVSCQEITYRMKNQRVCLTNDIYSLLNLFVFLL